VSIVTENATYVKTRTIVADLQEREERQCAEREAELERQKAELAEFERKIRGGRRRRQRRHCNAVDEHSSLLQKYTLPVLMPLLAIVLSVFIYWLLSTK